MKRYTTEIDSDIGILTIDIVYEVIGATGDGYNTPYEPAHINIIDIDGISWHAHNIDSAADTFREEVQEYETYDPEDYYDRNEV